MRSRTAAMAMTMFATPHTGTSRRGLRISGAPGAMPSVARVSDGATVRPAPDAAKRATSMPQGEISDFACSDGHPAIM